MNAVLLLIARFWQFLAELSNRDQKAGAQQVAAFVRYGGADDLGHVGWCFDVSASEANAGSVENPNGKPTSDPANMGYWDVSSSDPMPPFRTNGYNSLKLITFQDGDAIAACRTAKWVGLQPYSVIGRNCLDDVYDVLRAYGIPGLPVPAHDILPDAWFIGLDGQIEPVATYSWPLAPANAFHLFAASRFRQALPPLQPTWRTPGHPDWVDFQAREAAALNRHGPLLRGVDVSADQGQIDWSAVAESKQISFTYARAFHSLTASSFGDDPTFVPNHDGCERSAIPFGAYFFYIAGQDGVAQADHFLTIADGRFGMLAPMVDVEENSGLQGWDNSLQQRVDNLSACLEHIASRLCAPIIYTNKDTWDTQFGGSSAFSAYRLWVADPTAEAAAPIHMPAGWQNWTIQQYAIGRVPGINANVDLDCLNAKGIGVIRR